MSSAASSYKKQNGTITISQDGQEVAWALSGASTATVKLMVADIINLQQTPEKSSKVSIKIFVQRPGTEKPEDFTFTFTSATAARADQAAITNKLRQEIEVIRARKQQVAAPPPKAAEDAGGAPAAMAIAKALASSAKPEESVYTDAKLLANSELQRSLLQANEGLKQRFMQALHDKPDTITTNQFASQFWATRVHLLREHAVSRNQTQGSYNVLSEVKPKNVDGTNRMNLSKEQIQLIFKQHPVVKRVYDENVPQLSEMEFWSRFFVSRLFKKLKGEKITDNDPTDPKLDRYLNAGDGTDRLAHSTQVHVPRFIDLEGNEQNHSQRQGNAPDLTMQPNSHDRVPILRVLNSMSEKMMADVAPTDGEAHAPIGLDEETFNEIRLRDLQKDSVDNRIMLKIKDQKRFHSGDSGDGRSRESIIYSKQNPSQVLDSLQSEARALSKSNNSSSGMNLEDAIGVNDDSSSDEDQPNSQKKPHVGSKKSRGAANKQIIGAVRQRRAQTDDFSSPSGSFSAVQSSIISLPDDTYNSLLLTQNATIEFLHYFWTVFMSGDPDRAIEAQNLIGTLDKSLDRIKAIANQAETGRRDFIKKVNVQFEDHYQRTGKRRKPDLKGAPGGAEAVNNVMAPTIRAIKVASERYRKAYEEQMNQANLAQ